MISIEILNFALPLLYAAIIVVYGINFFRKSEINDMVSGIRRPLLLLIILLQAVYFILRSIEFNHAPITSSYEILTLLAFSISLSYFYIEIKTGVKDTGFFIMLIAGILQIISSLYIVELKEINPILKNWFLGFHVVFVLVGYSAITISGIYGMLYIKLYNDIKASRFGAVYKRLPSLDLLEKMTSNAVQFGFIALSLTILVGVIWLPHSVPNFSYADPKLITTLIVWIIYGVGFVSNRVKKFQSKTLMTMAFAGFIVTMFSVAIVNIFLSSFHKFN
ncbi:MAG: cytochrome C biogenesis protein [Ignavibacteriae bacterium]|nr:MAG: cytochrome C biogenesis protein [Ignavibacteriota bacterium]